MFCWVHGAKPRMLLQRHFAVASHAALLRAPRDCRIEETSAFRTALLPAQVLKLTAKKGGDQNSSRGQVVRPGGWVLLRHARNEGVPGQFRNGDGLRMPQKRVAAGNTAPSINASGQKLIV